MEGSPRKLLNGQRGFRWEKETFRLLHDRRSLQRIESVSRGLRQGGEILASCLRDEGAAMELPAKGMPTGQTLSPSILTRQGDWASLSGWILHPFTVNSPL